MTSGSRSIENGPTPDSLSNAPALSRSNALAFDLASWYATDDGSQGRALGWPTPEQRHVVHAFAVDRKAERLADLLVVERGDRGVGRQDEVLTIARIRQRLVFGVAFQSDEFANQRRVGHVDGAALQLQDHRRWVFDDRRVDAVEVRPAALPVILVLGET